MKRKHFSRFFVLLTLSLLLLSMPDAWADDSRNYSRILDYSDVLTMEQERSLSLEADRISNEYSCDILVVFTKSINTGKTITEDADDFFDYNNYGFGADHTGILFYIATSDREYAISTTGAAIDYFTDAGLSYIEEQFLPALRKNNWADAAGEFIGQTEKFIRQAQKGRPYDIGNLPVDYFNPVRVLGSCGLAALFSGIPMHKKMKSMTAVKAKQDAIEYVIPGSFTLTRKNDSFINKTVSRIPVSRSSSGGGGGSSIHSGSSGTSHGGSSGRF